MGGIYPSNPGSKDEFAILRVAELYRDDAGRGIVRISPKVMKRLGLKNGDVVEIDGKKKTGAKVISLRPDDTNDNIIRMDGLVRNNAKTSIGEKVRIKKIIPKIAKEVTIAPVEENVRLAGEEHLYKEKLLDKVVSKGDIISLTAQTSRPMTSKQNQFPLEGDFISRLFGFGPPLAFGEVRVVVAATQPGGIVKITNSTRINVLEEMPSGLDNVPDITYEDIGGLKDAIQRVREMIELPLKYPELFDKLGIEPPKGVLLHGPPGTGKTLLAKAVANESNATFLSINGPEIMSKFYGESEQRLREIFEKAEKSAPSIVFIDEIDSIAPKRENVTGEVERRVVAQLLTLLDGLKSRGRVIVIGATNRINAVDPALRRPGRFDREIELGVPDAEGRREILMIHTRNMPLAEDVDMDYLVSRTHGFVGADISALAKEAAMHALRRVIPKIDLDEPVISKEILDDLKVTAEDFEHALKIVEPSALREVMIEIPNVGWEDIGGLENVKRTLKEAVEWPLKYPEIFEYHGVRTPRGILLYGPPGTGKTLLAKAVANESAANFISIRGPEILSKWVGESERAIREIFRKGRQASPCVIFIDEIDAIAPMRGMRQGSSVTETVVNQILTEIDGIEDLKKVIVIAATNRPDILDPALLRAGRFDKLIFVPAPDYEARKAIFKVHMKNMKLADDVDIDELAKRTEGYVGADIENICREAVMIALHEDMNIRKITMKHFLKALDEIPPSVTPELIEQYANLKDRIDKMKEALLTKKHTEGFY